MKQLLLNAKFQFLIILLFAVIGMFAKLNHGDLPPLGSAAHASISREILRTGDWLTLHWPYCDSFSDFYQFPPIHFWLTAISYKIFGISDFSAVFSSSFFGVGCILLTYWLTYIIFCDTKISFVSSMLMITTPLLFKHSRKCELESILLFFVTLAFIFFLLGKKKNEKYYILFGISTGIAFLTKGPPGFAPFGAVFIYVLVTRDWNLFKNKFLWLGLIFGIIIPFLWIIPQLIYKGNSFYIKYIQGQILWSIQGRGIQKSLLDKIIGYLYFFPIMCIYYLPWGPFGFYGFYKMIKKINLPISPIRRVESEASSFDKGGLDFVLMISWICVVWIAFTIAGWKDNYYLLLLFPAWIIGVVLIIENWIRKPGINIKLTVISIGLLIIFIIFIGFTNIKLGKVRNSEFSNKLLIETIQKNVPKDKLIYIYKLYYWDMISLFPWYIDRGVTHTIETQKELQQKFINNSKNFFFMKSYEYKSLSQNIKNKSHLLIKSGKYVFLSN